MSRMTGIQWTDSTFNAWEGCSKVSPGCDNCYAEKLNERFHGGKHWGSGSERLLRSDKYWKEPLKWNAAHREFYAIHGRRQRVFCSSLADVFDKDAPAGQRERLFELIRNTPNLDWQILTKRAGNIEVMLPDDWGDGYPNVWLGITVVNQDELDRDVPKLLAIPSALRFLSLEPLLGRISFRWSHWVVWEEMYKLKGGVNHLDGLRFLDWIIVGGESGQNARPMHPDWARTIRDECQEAGVPFFFKQWGKWEVSSIEQGLYGPSMESNDARLVYPDGVVQKPGSKRKGYPGTGSAVAMDGVGKEKSGSTLDGKLHEEFPDVACLPHADIREARLRDVGKARMGM